MRKRERGMGERERQRQKLKKQRYNFEISKLKHTRRQESLETHRTEKQKDR